MEIILAPERIFQLTPQISFEDGRSKVEEKKIGLVAGMLGNLFSRPKPDDIALVGTQFRWEAFWHIGVHARTVYDRQRQYNVVAGGAEVKRVTLLGQTLSVDGNSKGGPIFTIPGVEHCEEDLRTTRTLTGAGAQAQDYARLIDLAKSEVADLSVFEGEGTIFVAPEMSSSAVVRQIMTEVVKPVKAHVIHEERVTLHMIDLYVRPVYGFEYHWAAKGKRAAIECDGLSGEIKQGGPSLTQKLRSMMNRDMLFDISAEAVGAVVPGAGIVVKLTKAAIDLKR